MPVFTQQPLTNFSTSRAYNAALPLTPPRNQARTQALQLATNGDVLIGRADNGVLPSLRDSGGFSPAIK